MNFRRLNRTKWLVIVAIMAILVVSCKSPTSPSGDVGTQIDASDPLDVLRALPTEINRPDSMVTTRYASSVSRAATVPTTPSEVFHPDALICPPEAKQNVDTASLAISLVQILKKMADNPFNADIVVDSGVAVSLGLMDMEEEIMAPLNALDLTIEYHGIQIDTIAATDSPNGVSGFAYYLPFTFTHEEGDIYLCNYFEFFFEDTENMVLTAYTYFFDVNDYYPEDYYKFHTTIMTVENGNQEIERYQCDIRDETEYSYEKFSYNIQYDTMKAFIIKRGSSEGISAITANQHGGMSFSTRFDDFTGIISGEMEAFAEDYNLMARFGDDEISAILPASISTAFDSDSTNREYSYRYLEDNLGDPLVDIEDVVITTDSVGDPEYVTEMYDAGITDPYEGVSVPVSDLFLLGSINTNILDYLAENLETYYSEIRVELDANLSELPGEAPGWERMDIVPLGVGVPEDLFVVFDAINSLP